MNERTIAATGFAQPIIVASHRKCREHGEVIGYIGQNASLLTAVAGTSAYLAPLIVPCVYRELKREMPWLWCYPRPHVSLSPRIGMCGFTDGCAWDARALGTALYALKKARLPNPVILVIAPEPFDIHDWWRPSAQTLNFAAKEGLYFENMDDAKIVYQTSGCTMVSCSNCRIRIDAPNPSWLTPGAQVDLVVLTLDGRHLNTLEFHKTHSFSVFERKAVRHFTHALARLDPSKQVVLALSGGGTRAAIVAHTALRLLVRNNMEPRAITACSGGAWGVVLYAQVGDQLGLAHLLRHGHIVYPSSKASKLGIMILNDVLHRRIDMLVHIIRALVHMKFDWKMLIQKMLFGHEPPMTWRMLFAALPTATYFVGFPGGVLAREFMIDSGDEGAEEHGRRKFFIHR
jgi:hypothetical protein